MMVRRCFKEKNKDSRRGNRRPKQTWRCRSLRRRNKTRASLRRGRYDTQTWLFVAAEWRQQMLCVAPEPCGNKALRPDAPQLCPRLGFLNDNQPSLLMIKWDTQQSLLLLFFFFLIIWQHCRRLDLCGAAQFERKNFPAKCLKKKNTYCNMDNEDLNFWIKMAPNMSDGGRSPSNQHSVSLLQTREECNEKVIEEKANLIEINEQKGMKNKPWKVNESLCFVLIGRHWTGSVTQQEKLPGGWRQVRIQQCIELKLTQGGAEWRSSLSLRVTTWSLCLNNQLGCERGSETVFFSTSRERTWAHLRHKKEALQRHLPELLSFPVVAHYRKTHLLPPSDNFRVNTCCPRYIVLFLCRKY